MSLSPQVVDRLFDRLTATYGRDFTSRWEGLDGNAVKSSWGHELACFAGCLHVIAWTLENLPERPPNAIEFRNLCRKAPAAEVPQLEAPKADPVRVAAELAKLAPARAAPMGACDHKAWAHRILARHASGERLSPTVLAMARDASPRRAHQTTQAAGA